MLVFKDWCFQRLDAARLCRAHLSALLALQCAGSCDAEGRRKPNVICKRLYPKSIDNPHPLRTGRKVDPKYCANARMPTPAKLKKKCSKPCPFRWVPGNWSEVRSVAMLILLVSINIPPHPFYVLIDKTSLFYELSILLDHNRYVELWLCLAL